MKFSPLKFNCIIAFVCLMSVSTLNAQKKYPSLLWEISGNGLSKPSYLYGTMHVSNKLVYHLSDSFFVALNSVSTVGLESNPDQWLRNMKNIGLLEQLNNPNTYSNNDFYKDAFKFEIPDNKKYAEILANDPDIVNNLLYRNTTTKDDQEESTYIDLFIYKTGSKLDKKIVSLEDFTNSLVMARKASTPDNEEINYEERRKIDYFKIQTDISDAYRNGDLDALDSLVQLSYTTKNFQKYLIEERNVIMARSIDSVSKTGSLFSGIGAAHLPGPNGVIELLRKKGYKVRPVANTSTKKMLKEKEKIEAIIKKMPATKQYAKDSLFTFELFDAPINLANLKGQSFYLATDMTNGSYYTISRQITYAPFYNYTVDKMMIKIDSLLYENIPGKIISRKDISTSSGLKGLDIINKTKRGDLQRYHIYFMENELIVFKMSGKADYIKGPEGVRFFNSIQFSPVKKATNLSYSPPTQGFSATISGNYNYVSSKRSGVQGLAESLFAYDPDKKIINGEMQYFYHDFNYLEEDTFELNVLCSSTLKNFGYTVNTKRELGKEQNLPCINFSGENTSLNKVMTAKLFIKGVHYYLAYTISDKNAPSSDPYLSSFRLTDFKHINEMKTITDHKYSFVVKDEMVPEDRNYLDEALEGFYENIEKEKNSKNHSTDFDYHSKSKTYYSPSSGEHVNIDYEKFNDYDYRNPDEIWENVKRNTNNNASFIITNTSLKKENGITTFDMVLKDTACTNILKRKYILKDGLLFCLTAICDSVNGTTGWTDSFLKSFTPKDTIFSKPLFELKTASLLKNLSSPDSSLRYAAKQSLAGNLIEKKSASVIIDYLKTPEFLKLDEDSRATILVNSGDLKDEKMIPVYKNLYATYEDSSYMQICLIKGLGYLRTQSSYNTIYDLLKNKTPLTGDESNISDIISPLYDSLELCSGFFPGLFSLSTFEEYKNPMFRLFSDLVIRGLAPPAKYAANVPVLLTDASNELKRYNTSAGKSSKTNYEEQAEELAREMADYVNESVNEANTKTTKKTYPSYSAMIENYAVVLAPFHATNPMVKQYFDKLFKIKNEKNLLNICLIAVSNKIAVNDTVWKFFSNNKKTKLKLYNELKKLNMLDKFDKTAISQEEFCKTKIETDIEMTNYNYGEDNSALIQKTKADSIYFLKKEPVKNKTQDGNLYFFERVDAKAKTKSLAYVFVPNKNEVTTNLEVIDTRYVTEIGKKTEESIEAICADFYYRGRNRYILQYIPGGYTNNYDE